MGLGLEDQETTVLTGWIIRSTGGTLHLWLDPMTSALTGLFQDILIVQDVTAVEYQCAPLENNFQVKKQQS